MEDSGHTPSSRRRAGQRLVAGVLLLAVGVFVGRYVVPAQTGSSAPFRITSVGSNNRQLAFPPFWEAWDKLHTHYIGDLDDKELLYGAVEGMVRAADDPYTVFSDPGDTKQFNQTLEGSFSGVGIEIGMRGGQVTVIAPLDGSPAKEAGVREGDIIVAVDGEPITQDVTMNDVVQMIRGPKGEDVVLTVVHEGRNEPEEITITRDTIEIESVKTNVENGIVHIEITSFNGDTSKRFSEATQRALEANARGIIVDVRNNPGGFLQVAVDIASHFLKPGSLVVTERGAEETAYKSSGPGELNSVPTVVLVNGGSASASEILAGALHDQLNVPVIGTKTFGKGSVQEMLPLSDGSSLRVTVAKWYTPSGRSISDEGIEPTITVEPAEEGEGEDGEAQDLQLERAREELDKLIESN